MKYFLVDDSSDSVISKLPDGKNIGTSLKDVRQANRIYGFHGKKTSIVNENLKAVKSTEEIREKSRYQY